MPGDDDDGGGVGVVAPALAEATAASLDPEADAVLGSPASAVPLSESVGANESGALVGTSSPGAAGASGSIEQVGGNEGAASSDVQVPRGTACGRLLGGARNPMDDPEVDIVEMEDDAGDVGDDAIGPDDWLGMARDAFEQDVPPEGGEGIAARSMNNARGDLAM